MPNLQLHYGDRSAYAVRAAGFAPGATVTVKASDAKSVLVEPDTAFVPVVPDPYDPKAVIVVARGQLVGGSKMQEAVRVHAQIVHADGGVTHAIMQTVDVVGSPIQFDLKDPVAFVPPRPAPIVLREPAVEKT